jgi:hypothetical protein
VQSTIASALQIAPKPAPHKGFLSHFSLANRPDCDYIFRPGSMRRPALTNSKSTRGTMAGAAILVNQQIS